MKRTIFILLTVIFLFSIFFSFPASSQSSPKREFRGAWIHVIAQNQYKSMSSGEMKQYFIYLLDSLK
jgi:hypothetical protein